MSINFKSFIDLSILYIFFSSVILYFVLHKSWPFIFNNLKLKKYKNVQRAHFYEAPRLGGLIMYLSTLFYYLLSDLPLLKSFLGQSLLFFLPVLVFSIKEDFFSNVSPLLRLLTLLLSSILFVSFNFNEFAIFNLPVLDTFMLSPVGFLFYCLLIATVANGCNLSDGVNALCACISIAIFLSIIFLAYKCHDIPIMMLASFFIFQLLVFIFFNYPRGLVFLGDTGAYFLGFFASILLLILFSRNEELNYFAVILILIYPLTEVAFTFLRRVISGEPVSSPDRLHLHLLIYDILRKKRNFKKYSNITVMPLLAFFWLYPLILIPFVYTKVQHIFLAVSFFILGYFLIYKKLLKKEPNKEGLR
jgi:UDP-GlcNAc:undecaprenyl-phosphate GlcNAc-1-phosphate transferase